MLPAVAKSCGQLRHTAHFAHWLAMAYTLAAHWLFEAFLIHIANCTTKYAPTSRFNQSFRDPLEDAVHGRRNIHALAATACDSSEKEVHCGSSLRKVRKLKQSGFRRPLCPVYKGP